MKSYVKRAQDNYLRKRREQGWRSITFFSPKCVNEKMRSIRKELMAEFRKEGSK